MKAFRIASLLIAGALSLGASGVAPAVVSQSSATDGRDVEARYQEGLKLERRGHLRAAVEAYREAADEGHGMAQRKLGDIYGTGKGGVRRDYEDSLRWYSKTREQGIEIPNKPFIYPGVRR